MSKRDRDDDDDDDGTELGGMSVDAPPPTDEGDTGVLIDVANEEDQHHQPEDDHHHHQKDHVGHHHDEGMDDDRNEDDGSGMLSTAVEVLSGGGGVSNDHVSHQDRELPNRLPLIHPTKSFAVCVVRDRESERCIFGGESVFKGGICADSVHGVRSGQLPSRNLCLIAVSTHPRGRDPEQDGHPHGADYALEPRGRWCVLRTFPARSCRPCFPPFFLRLRAHLHPSNLLHRHTATGTFEKMCIADTLEERHPPPFALPAPQLEVRPVRSDDGHPAFCSQLHQRTPRKT